MPTHAHAIFPDAMLEQARALIEVCASRGVTITTAESCTGGLVSALLTEISGSSAVFTHGFIAYANAAKIAMLGVHATILESHGAVSEVVAIAMAEGALRQSGATLSVALTGIAGPHGGTAEKPVGTVHIASANAHGNTLHAQYRFEGTRHAVRLQAVEAALVMLRRQVEGVE